jgi:hypothetical protein
MSNLVFVMLLTLKLTSGTGEDEQTYHRTQLWTAVKAKNYDVCNDSKVAEIARFKAVWQIIADRTKPDATLDDVTAICVGMNPNDPLPKDGDE